MLSAFGLLLCGISEFTGRLYLQPSTLAKRGSLLLFLTIIAFYLFGLGHFPLVGPDEPRYAQVAREMLLRGDLITPTLGGIVWFEKPALLYWMMIGSYKLFGVSEWAARLPSAIAGVLTVAAVFLVGRKAEQKTSDEQLHGLGFWSAVAASTTLGLIVFSRAASFDIILTMTIAWALAFFIIHEFETETKVRIFLLAGFYIFIGLSLLAKGFIGAVITVGTVSGYYLLRRKIAQRDTLLSVLWGVPLLLLVAASWYGPVMARHGNAFVDKFIWQHQFARYVSNNYRHPGPFYYYLTILIPLSVPWTIFLIGGLARAVSRSWPGASEPEDQSKKYVAFALVWFLLPLVFFTFSSSKLPGYILPSLPAAALLIGERLTRLTNVGQTSLWKLKATGACCVAVAVGLPLFAWRWEKALIVCAFVASGILLVSGLFAVLTTRRRSLAVGMLSLASLGVVVVVLFCAANRHADRDSSKRLLQLADARGYSQTPIYGLKLDDRSPEFYAAGRITYMPDGEPYIYEGPPQLVNESRRRGAPLLSFVPLEGVSELSSAHTAQTEVIGDNGRVALVVVKPR